MDSQPGFFAPQNLTQIPRMMGPGNVPPFKYGYFCYLESMINFWGGCFVDLFFHTFLFDKNQGRKETSLQTFPCYSWKRNKKHHGLSSHRILRNLRIQLPPGISRAVLRHPFFPRKTKRSWPPCWLRIPPRSGPGQSPLGGWSQLGFSDFHPPWLPFLKLTFSHLT